MCQPHSSHQKLLQGAVDEDDISWKHCERKHSLFHRISTKVMSCSVFFILALKILCPQTLYLHTIAYVVLFWEFPALSPLPALFQCWSCVKWVLPGWSVGTGQLGGWLKASLFVGQPKVTSKTLVVLKETCRGGNREVLSVCKHDSGKYAGSGHVKSSPSPSFTLSWLSVPLKLCLFSLNLT